MFGNLQHATTCILHVVDTTESAYHALFQPLLNAGWISLRFFDTAGAALRHAQNGAEGVWFVAMELPDLPGPQVIEMLIGIHGNKLIVAVGNSYSTQEETAALASGASQYFVKPLAEYRCWAVIEAYLNSELNSTAGPLDDEAMFFVTRSQQQ
jgi:DNA-binding NtrC family response regulator